MADRWCVSKVAFIVLTMLYSLGLTCYLILPTMLGNAVLVETQCTLADVNVNNRTLTLVDCSSDGCNDMFQHLSYMCIQTYMYELTSSDHTVVYKQMYAGSYANISSDWQDEACPTNTGTIGDKVTCYYNKCSLDHSSHYLCSLTDDYPPLVLQPYMIDINDGKTKPVIAGIVISFSISTVLIVCSTYKNCVYPCRKNKKDNKIELRTDSYEQDSYIDKKQLMEYHV
jgi:hypothetical protein